MVTTQRRRQEKIILMDGAVPTVPTVSDHTQPGWLETDIYIGELCFCRSGSSYNVYSRDTTGIFQITRTDFLYDLINQFYNDLAYLIGLKESTAHSKFEHYQAVPSATWAITHNMDKKPSVTVLDSGGDENFGNVIYVDNNSIQINFSAAFSGYAYLN